MSSRRRVVQLYCRVFDVDGDGLVTREEMERLVTDLYCLLPPRWVGVLCCGVLTVIRFSDTNILGNQADDTQEFFILQINDFLGVVCTKQN